MTVPSVCTKCKLDSCGVGTMDNRGNISGMCPWCHTGISREHYAYVGMEVCGCKRCRDSYAGGVIGKDGFKFSPISSWHT